MKNYLEYIEELEKRLTESTHCLKSILYVPEQVNWNGEEGYKPQWLVNQIKENENLLKKEK